jgi:hypothetical protein
MDFASPSTRGEGAQATRRLIDLLKTLRVGVTKVRFRSSTTFCVRHMATRGSTIKPELTYLGQKGPDDKPTPRRLDRNYS